MRNLKCYKFKEGLTLVEVLIATAIILVAVVALLSVHNLYLQVALSNNESIKAAYLAEEGIEAMRFRRDASWNTNIGPLTLGTEYGVVLDGGMWVASTTNKFVGSFERVVVLSAVGRDSSNDIVTSGGSIDANTLLLTSRVSWHNGKATTTKSISTYLTNIYGN